MATVELKQIIQNGCARYNIIDLLECERTKEKEKGND
jgi:hypothetical protein